MYRVCNVDALRAGACRAVLSARPGGRGAVTRVRRAPMVGSWRQRAREMEVRGRVPGVSAQGARARWSMRGGIKSRRDSGTPRGSERGGVEERAEGAMFDGVERTKGVG